MLLSLFCCDGSRRSPVRVPRACSRVLPCRVPRHTASCRPRLHRPCQRRLPRSLCCCCRQCHCSRQPAHCPQGPRLSTSHTHPLAKPHCANTAHHRTSQARSQCAGAQPRAASGRLRSAQTARSSLRPATSSRPRTARRCARCSCVPHASPTQQPSRQTSALPRSWLFVHPSFLFFFFIVCVAPCWHRRQRSSTASCSGRCWSWSSVLPSRRRVCAAPSLVFFFSFSQNSLGVHTEMQKEQEKHEDEDYVEAPKRKRGRPPAAS